MRKISNKLLIILLLFISFICNAKEEVLFSINNNPTTTIDLNQRINYLSLLSNIDINKINKKKYIEDLVSVKLFNEFAEIKNIKTKDKLLNNYYEKIEINNKERLQILYNNKILTKEIIIENILYDLQRKNIIENIINDRIDEINLTNNKQNITNIYNIELNYFVITNNYKNIIKKEYQELLKKNTDYIKKYLDDLGINFHFFTKNINNLDQINQKIKNIILENKKYFYLDEENYFMIGVIKKELKNNIGLNYSFFQIKSNNNVDFDSIINEVKCENIETTEIYSKFNIKEYKNINIENLNISIFQNLTKINEKLVIQNNDKKYIVILCDINYNEKVAKDNIKDNNVQKIAKKIEIEFIKMKKKEFNFQTFN